MALNPVIKFTTLFGLLAVELAVNVAAEAGVVADVGDLRRRSSRSSLVFVWRSFYSMRIEIADTPGEAGDVARV